MKEDVGVWLRSENGKVHTVHISIQYRVYSV
jgi:hypothetical protein